MATSIGGTFALRAAEDAIAAHATTVTVVPNGAISCMSIIRMMCERLW